MKEIKFMKKNDRSSMQQWINCSKLIVSASTVLYYMVQTRNQIMAKIISIEKEKISTEKEKSFKHQSLEHESVEQKTKINDSINDIIKKSKIHIKCQSGPNLFEVSESQILQVGINVQSPTVVYQNMTLKGDLNISQQFCARNGLIQSCSVIGNFSDMIAVPQEVTNYANFLGYATQTYSASSGINFDTAIGIRLFDQVNLGYWVCSKKGVFINVDIAFNSNKELVVLKRPSKTRIPKMQGGGGEDANKSQAGKSVEETRQSEVTTQTSAQEQSAPLTETSNINLAFSTGEGQENTGSHFAPANQPPTSSQFEGSGHVHASAVSSSSTSLLAAEPAPVDAVAGPASVSVYVAASPSTSTRLTPAQSVSIQSNPTMNVSNPGSGGIGFLTGVTLTALSLGVIAMGFNFFARQNPNRRGLF
jgi:hypothetical protein